MMTKVGMPAVCVILALLSLVMAAAGEKDYYRLVAKDVRMCPSPMCGGYYIERVNVKASRQYVFQMLYSDSDVAATVAKFAAARWRPLQFTKRTAAVVFYGDLVNRTAPYGPSNVQVKDLKVTAAYLGMPGQPDARGLNFYTIATTKIATSAKLLNSRSRIQIKRSSVTPVKPTNNLDLPWQLNQILTNGALVAATIKPALRSTYTISVKAVYIKLPVFQGPCPMFKISCDPAKGGRVVYKRTEDLCFIPSCSYGPQMACTLSIPTCPNGYKLAGWPAPPGGCNKYACDPIYIPTTSMLDS